MVAGLQVQPDAFPLSTGAWWQGLLAAGIVLGLLAALVVLAKKGALGGMMREERPDPGGNGPSDR